MFNFDGKAPPPAAASPVAKLEEGFFSIAGATVDARGKLYFVDRKFQRIYSWLQGEGLMVVRDAPLDAVNLAIDASGAMLVLSSHGPRASVYSFRPDGHAAELTVLQPVPAVARPGARTIAPVNFWNNGEFRDQINPQTYEFTTLAEMFARDIAIPKAREYVSPDGSLVLPEYPLWRQGPTDHLGWRWSDTLQTHGFSTARQGERVVFTNGSENRTFSAVMGPGGRLTDPRLLANRGGESAVADKNGNVYVANGQVFVYGPDGKETGRIDVPERPLQLIFGGANFDRLFILTHRALYGVTP